METRAKYALIGLFTICVVAAAFGFVFWFSGSRVGVDRKSVEVIFDTPVTGLSQGAAVLFNGIRVGEVTELTFGEENKDPNIVVVRIDILAKVPITVTTQARLEFSGLTGVASIQLFDTGKRSPEKKLGKQETMLKIYAVPSPSLQSVLETAQTAGKHADEALIKINQILAENEKPIGNIVANVEALTRALDAKKINDAVDHISELAAKFDVDSLNHAISSVDKVVSAIDVTAVNHILANADTFTKTLADNADKVRVFADDAVALVDKLKGTASAIDDVVRSNSANLHEAIASLDNILKGIDAGKVGHTLDNIDKFSTTLADHSADTGEFIKQARDLATGLNRVSAQVEAFMNSGAPGSLTRSLAKIEDITKHIDGTKLDKTLDGAEKFATALGNNAPRVDTIAQNVNELFAKLNKSADKVDDILKGVSNLVNSPEGKSAFTEFAEASRSVKKAADDLDKRSAELLVNLTRFSGPGLREFQQFAIDGRRTLGDISRTLQSVQRNPQQFIFGGKASLPEYGN